MRRIRVILTSAITIVAVVLVFAFPAMAMSPRGTIGEGRTDIKEGHHFIEKASSGGARERCNRAIKLFGKVIWT